MYKSIILLLGLFIYCGTINAQKKSWIKLDILRAAFYADIGISYELKNENSGFEAQMVYINDFRRITDRSGFNGNLMNYNSLPRFDFKEQRLDAIFSYRWYPKSSVKRKFYYGITNINHIHLYLEDGYADKFEEVYNTPPDNTKTLKSFIGATIGFIIKINDKMKAEIGIEYVYEIGPIFKKEEPFYIIGHLPVKFSYKL